MGGWREIIGVGLRGQQNNNVLQSHVNLLYRLMYVFTGLEKRGNALFRPFSRRD